MTWWHGIRPGARTRVIPRFIIFGGARLPLAVHAWRQGCAPTSPDICPLTRFFEGKGLRDSEAALWHAQIDAGVDVREASRKLLHWLAVRVREDRQNHRSITPSS
uniref:Uncharacterized protein n=1 Tax=mine drainage metagenome TaxID=410659 RepID=E6PQ70_9ZZZZ